MMMIPIFLNLGEMMKKKHQFHSLKNCLAFRVPGSGHSRKAGSSTIRANLDVEVGNSDAFH